MNKINWSVRLKNKNFWLAVVPALALLFQAFANISVSNWNLAKPLIRSWYLSMSYLPFLSLSESSTALQR